MRYEFSKGRAIRTLLYIIKKTGLLILVLILAGFLFYLSVLAGTFGALPTNKALRSIKNSTPSEVYSADGVLLGRYYIQDRSNVSYKDISPNVIAALLATEDVRFYSHRGIDARSTFRVFFKTMLLQEESSGGGSTLSQQLAKNLYPRKDYGILSTPVNKLKEMITANRLESFYSKEAILELYLNTVPMGSNVYGIERAAGRFFNTSAADLKIEQAAVLVGMLKATTSYNPRNYPERSKQRRNVVMNQMVKYGFLESHKADSLKRLPLGLKYNNKGADSRIAAYFKEQLRLELEKWCAAHEKDNGDNYNLYTDGLKIYTTLNARLQAQAEKAVKQKMAYVQQLFNQHWNGRQPWGNNKNFISNAIKQSLRYKQLQEAGMDQAEIDKVFNTPVKMSVFSWSGYKNKVMSPRDSVIYYQRLLNTGLLAIEPQTGYVRVWVGGIDHRSFKYDHVLSRRQVGSTFKPFVYTAALENGLDPCQYFPNQRLAYPEYENWSPKNADGRYGGEYSMRGALAHSVNTISAQVLLQTGIEPTIRLAHQMGIHSEIPKVPSIALGTANLSLMEMVAAYTTFANKGRYNPPVYLSKIKEQSGAVIFQHVPAPAKQAFSEESAAIMIQLLKGVVEEGSASTLRSQYGLKMDIAGKTGTTQNHADGWFIGITPKLVTGVWVGAESPLVRFRTLALGQGAKTALPIWGEFMRRISKEDNLRYARFETLPDYLAQRMSCASFRYEQEVLTEEKESFFERIFKRKKDKGKRKGWKIFGGWGKKEKSSD